jgi:hypothetical protein
MTDQASALPIEGNLDPLQIDQSPRNLEFIPNEQAQPVVLPTRATTVTKVYYRKKFKSKTKELEAQAEPRNNIFPVIPESYKLSDPLPPPDGFLGAVTRAKKKRSITPVSTKMLRRSSRLKTRLDGFKPQSPPSTKKMGNKGRTKGKKVALACSFELICRIC